jgi:hypothetical protein
VLVVFFCVGGSDTGSACHLLATEGCELLSDGLLGLSLTGSDRSEAGSNEHRWCQPYMADPVAALAVHQPVRLVDILSFGSAARPRIYTCFIGDTYHSHPCIVRHSAT